MSDARNNLIALTVDVIMRKDNINKNEALNLFLNSKTLQFIDENKLYHFSGARCWVELHYELSNDVRWMHGDLD